MGRQMIPSLDGIRALSILIVFAAHAGVSRLIPGGFGVTVFFFLSGFLITSLLIAEHARYGSISIKGFYLRRIVRLGPPLLVTLAFAALLVVLGVAEGDLDPEKILSHIFFYSNYLIVFSSNFASNVEGLGILWSLAVEEHFYLFYPWFFLLLATGKIGLRGLLAILLVILLWRVFWYVGFGATEEEIYVRTDTRIDSLLYGCLLAFMVSDGTAARLFPKKYIYPVLALCGLALIFTFVFRDPTFRSTLRYSVQGLALLPMFYYAVTLHDLWLFKPLNWGPVRRIGQYSYTMYLIHFVIIKALVFNGIAVESMPLFVLTAFVLSVVYSALVFEFFEKPLKPLRQRLTGH